MSNRVFVDASGNIILPGRPERDLESGVPPTDDARRLLRSVESSSRHERPSLIARLKCDGGGLAPSFYFQLVAFTLACMGSFWFSHPMFVAAVVVVGWLISLTLHEFGHAFVAYKGGDASIVDKGYLSLDLLRYADPMMTFVVPTLLLLLGGVALPGAAVSVSTGSLRSRSWETGVALAGPMMNFLFGGIVALMAALSRSVGHVSIPESTLCPALTVLAYYQVMAMILNLIPLPPLDGWGAVSPWLPASCFLKRLLANPWHAKSVMMITFLVIFAGVQWIPGIGLATRTVASLYRLDGGELQRGMRLMMEVFKLPF